MSLQRREFFAILGGCAVSVPGYWRGQIWRDISHRRSRRLNTSCWMLWLRRCCREMKRARARTMGTWLITWM